MFGLKKKEKKADAALMGEKEVLEALEIPSFKKMKKEKVKDFAALIPKIDPEVTKTALQQFPHFAQMAGEVVSYYKDIIGQALKENALNAQSFYSSCDTTINTLNLLLENEKLSFRKKKKITDQIMQVLKMKEMQNREEKEWLKDVIRTTSITAVAIVAIVGKTIIKTMKNPKK